jgi:hypothetical protein
MNSLNALMVHFSTAVIYTGFLLGVMAANSACIVRPPPQCMTV